MAHAPSRCRSCRQEVRWVTMHPSGKKNPLNPEPDAERGNVLVCETPEQAQAHGVREGVAITFERTVATAARGRGVELYLSHFATCPTAGEHRKKARG